VSNLQSGGTERDVPADHAQLRLDDRSEYVRRKFIVTYRVTFVENSNGYPESVTVYEDDAIDQMVMQHNTSSTELELTELNGECSTSETAVVQHPTVSSPEVSRELAGEGAADGGDRFPTLNLFQYQESELRDSLVSGVGGRVHSDATRQRCRIFNLAEQSVMFRRTMLNCGWMIGQNTYGVLSQV